jgi:steroid delta-isomerase-like uncharacterized protein
MKAQAEVEEQNKEIIKRYFAAVDNGDVEAVFALVDEVFAPDCIGYTATSELRGIDAAKERFTGAYDVYEEMQHIFEEIIADGNIVSARCTFQATHIGELWGVPATGKQLSCPVLYMFRFEDGKIKENLIDSDSLRSLAMQLGMELKPKEEK